MNIEEKIAQLGHELPSPPKPVGSYVAAIRCGGLVFTAGQLPSRDGELITTGKLAAGVSVEQGQQAARRCVLNALAAIRGELGGLDRIERIVRLNVYVNSAPGFTAQAQVANGASDLLVELLGEAGKHTRCAIGTAELPLGAPVELDLIVAVKAG